MKYNLILCCCILFSVILNQTCAQQQSVCSSPEQNTDFKEKDFSFTLNAKSPQECAKTCSILIKSCTGFTFWRSNSVNYCFLKNFTRTPQRTYSNGRVSCIMAKVPYNPGGTVYPTNSYVTTKTTIMPTTRVTTRLTSRTTQTAFSTAPSVSTTSPAFVFTTTVPIGPTTKGLCSFQTYAFYGPAATAFDFSNANSASECCDLCRKDGANCAAFSYLTKEKMCYVYSSPLNDVVQTPNVIGGTPN